MWTHHSNLSPPPATGSYSQYVCAKELSSFLSWVTSFLLLSTSSMELLWVTIVVATATWKTRKSSTAERLNQGTKSKSRNLSASFEVTRISPSRTWNTPTKTGENKSFEQRTLTQRNQQDNQWVGFVSGMCHKSSENRSTPGVCHLLFLVDRLPVAPAWH